jgi:peptidoglycan/LPS O-acetylase OafA/YrhL
VAVLVSYAVAWVVFHAVEQPFLRLKRHFESPREPAETAPATLLEADPTSLPSTRPVVARAA